MTNQQLRFLSVALLAALLVTLALSGVSAQGGSNVQQFKAARLLNWLNIGTDLSVGGNASVTGDTTLAGSQSNANWVKIAAPTAIGTATPALVVDSAGTSNLLALRKNATSVFRVDGSGNLTINGTINGVKCYRGQQSVLGSATAIPATLTAAGISTPSWASESFAAAPGNTYWNKAHLNAGGIVTFTVYSNMLSGTVTPQAATTAVALDYEICGQ